MAALTLIRDARVYGPAPLSLEPVDVLVAGHGIVAIGPSLAATLGLSSTSGHVEIVDCEGRALVPGFVDGHVHLTGGGGEAGFQTRVPRLMLSSIVRAGVTTVVGVLGTDGVTRTMRDLVATVLGLRAEGLSAYCYTGNYAVPPPTLTGSVKDDIVFVDPIIGVGELALSDHRSSQPTYDELLRIASDAYVAGLTAGKSGVVHLHMGDGARGLELVRRALAESELPARLWHPTHLNRNPSLWGEALALASEPQRPYCDVTAFPADDADPGMPAERAVIEWLDAGLPANRITVSSDGGGCLPSFDADGRMTAMGVGACATMAVTLSALVRSGVSLDGALPCVTSNPARVLGLTAKGRIAVGADADLIILDPDTAMPSSVMARGRFVVRDGVLTEGGRGVFERPFEGKRP